MFLSDLPALTHLLLGPATHNSFPVSSILHYAPKLQVLVTWGTYERNPDPNMFPGGVIGEDGLKWVKLKYKGGREEDLKDAVNGGEDNMWSIGAKRVEERRRKEVSPRTSRVMEWRLGIEPA